MIPDVAALPAVLTDRMVLSGEHVVTSAEVSGATEAASSDAHDK